MGEITDTDKKVGARWMEVFCAAVEYTDHQIGRIVEVIEETANSTTRSSSPAPATTARRPRAACTTSSTVSAEGTACRSRSRTWRRRWTTSAPRVAWLLPAAWAYATSTPFTYGKTVTSGGGCSTGAVMSWPARITDHGGIRGQFHHLIDVAPTILECAGVPEPTRVNGIDQKPMDGVSMLYTLDDAKAQDAHTTQYFELTGSRAVYHEGWWAGTRHGLDGVTVAARPALLRRRRLESTT